MNMDAVVVNDVTKNYGNIEPPRNVSLFWGVI